MKSEKAKEYITHATCTAQEYAERFGGRELVVSRWDVSTAIELIDYDNAAEWRGDLERKPSLYQWLPINGNTL